MVANCILLFHCRMMTMHQIGNRYELLFLTPILSAPIAPFFSVCLQVECSTGGLHGQTVMQDIKPRFHHSRIHGADGAEEDEVCRSDSNAGAISLSSWLCYFLGGLAELGKC